jgi:hypothetical protein
MDRENNYNSADEDRKSKEGRYVDYVVTTQYIIRIVANPLTPSDQLQGRSKYTITRIYKELARRRPDYSLELGNVWRIARELQDKGIIGIDEEGYIWNPFDLWNSRRSFFRRIYWRLRWILARS